MEVRELMSVNELKAKIKNREIDSIYIELEYKNENITYPLYIIGHNITDEYFDCHISWNRYMRFYYKDYMIKFWTKGDKSE